MCPLLVAWVDRQSRLVFGWLLQNRQLYPILCSYCGREIMSAHSQPWSNSSKLSQTIVLPNSSGATVSDHPSKIEFAYLYVLQDDLFLPVLPKTQYQVLGMILKAEQFCLKRNYLLCRRVNTSFVKSHKLVYKSVLIVQIHPSWNCVHLSVLRIRKKLSWLALIKISINCKVRTRNSFFASHLARHVTKPWASFSNLTLRGYDVLGNAPRGQNI